MQDNSSAFPHRFSIASFGRLHFGLLEISKSEPNCFGGIGLMIEHAKAVVQATVLTPNSEPNERWAIAADPYWKPRIESVVQNWRRTSRTTAAVAIDAIESPSPHRGLGSGTQMACTVATLLAYADHVLQSKTKISDVEWSLECILSVGSNQPDTSRSSLLERLATISGRGKRSNIGLQGFLEGGFVFDHGRTPVVRSGECRTERITFPEEWPVIIIQDRTSYGDFGSAESTMFELCSKKANPNRSAMIDLVRDELIPAIQEKNWENFDMALGQYGRFAGEIFSVAQGGIYRSASIARAIDLANKLGLQGATQSSWGPAVCVIARDMENAQWCKERFLAELPDSEIHLTKAWNRPAQVVAV